MSKVIKIYNPNEKPFGLLSNNHKFLMRMDRIDWYTVTSYIYANILKTPMYKQQIRLTKVKDVKKDFQKLYQQEIDDVIGKAVERALKVKFTNIQLADLLVGTGNAPIFYVSDNKLLGIGLQNDGQNLYGQYLMQVRHLLRIAFKQEKESIVAAERDQMIYDAYLAEKGLNNAINQGNDLTEFINKTPAEIVERLGRTELTIVAPKRDAILELAHKGVIPDIVNAVDHPENLVLEVRKRKMRDLRLRKLAERKDIVFDMYADYLLEKHFSDVSLDDYAKAKDQQFKNIIGTKQEYDLKKRLYDLFNQGMLSGRLSDAIDERLAYLTIPSEEEVEEAENMVITYETKPLVEEPYVPASGTPILVYPVDFPQLDEKYKPYVMFSPISLTGMLNIDGRSYPTVTHFIIASMMAYIPSIGGLHKAFPHLLADPEAPISGIQSFVDPDTANARYAQLRDVDYQEQLRKHAKVGLDKKFEDRVMQDMLLITGDARLVWNDFTDDVLGSGEKGKGENFVGKYLMKLRGEIASIRGNEKIDQIRGVHIAAILDEDPFMREWLQMRVKDMCKVLTTMKNYIWSKDEISIEMNANFVSAVLDKVYQPCSHVFGASNLVVAEVPDYFSYMATKCPGFSKVEHDVIEVMWKRVTVIIYYLINFMQKSDLRNLRAIIANVELLVTKGAPCVDIVPDEYDNCIVSALINLLRGLIEFNKQFSYSTVITEKDVNTAASIILNADVSDEVKYVEPIVSDKIEPDAEINEIFDDDDEFIFPSAHERDDISGYESIEEDIQDIYSPNHNLIVPILQEIEEIQNPELIARAIESAVETIKTYPMSKQIKRNRINFFASQR